MKRDLDETDRAIIEQLQQDGRAPYTKLAAAVGLSEAAVRQRVQRLIDSGTIQIVAVTNPMQVGYRRVAMIGIATEGPMGPIIEQLEQMEHLEYLIVTAGSFDLLCEVVVPDDSSLLTLITAIRAVPGVRSTETFMYLDLVKQTFGWGAH